MEVDNKAIGNNFLRYMPDIVATCIILHNLYIVNNEGIEEDWIVEVEKKPAKRIINFFY